MKPAAQAARRVTRVRGWRSRARSARRPKQDNAGGAPFICALQAMACEAGAGPRGPATRGFTITFVMQAKRTAAMAAAA